MIDFEINFIDINTFEFVDNSDYSGTTVVDTNLEFYLPPIDISQDSNDILLFSTTIPDLPVLVLGDNAVIDLTQQPIPFTLVDGVYRVLYNVILDGGTTTTAERIFVKDLDLLQCKKTMVKDTLFNTESSKCQACDAVIFQSALESAHHEANLGNYKEATEIVEELKKQCDICNC